MAQLAIRRHATRGNEVIEILEMLGGNNKYNFRGDEDEWFILNRTIQRSDRLLDEKGFTLEEFLEKFPYKVGDKVEFNGIGVEITGMYWLDNTINYEGESIKLGSKYDCLSVQDLKPYKEETMKEKTIPPYMDNDIKEGTEKNYPPKTQVDVDKYLQEHSVKNVMNVVDIETCLEMDGLKLPENVVINSKGIGSIQFIQWYEKSKYPRDFDECCEVLNLGEDGKLWTKGYKSSLVQSIHQLIICRDAYWKIAGEQMGLGKPWKPDWNDCVQHKFGLYTLENEIRCINLQVLKNIILVFPTEEMRDEFYNNFKDLIERCKELL